jgi:hypothetical protein
MYSGEARHAPVAYQIAIVKDIRTIQEHKANAHLVSPFTAMAYDDLGEDMEVVLGNVLRKTIFLLCTKNQNHYRGAGNEELRICGRRG